MKKGLCMFVSLLCIFLMVTACGKNSEDENEASISTMELVNEVPAERIANRTVEPATSFAGGNGTEESPYEISNAAELQYFANLFYDYRQVDSEGVSAHENKYQSAYYILTNDIVINSDDEMRSVDSKAPTYKWEAIGRHSADDNVNHMDFKGNFDGQNHCISGLYNCVLGEGEDHPDATLGFFGKLSGATVCNLTIKNAYFYVYNTVGSIGALASTCFESYINNCHCENISIYAHSSIGGTAGLVGEIISTANIANCSVSGEVKGGYSSEVGGITSDLGDGLIENCTNNAAVTGLESANAGGICCSVSDSATIGTYEQNKVDTYAGAKNHGKVSVAKCINNGAVTSQKGTVGGIAARAHSGKESISFSDCKNVGNIIGKQEVGGICGALYSEKGVVENVNGTVGTFTVTNCENTGVVEGETMLGGIVGHAWVDDAATLQLEGCTNFGKITGSTIGGVVGTAQAANAARFTIISCVNNGEISCRGTSIAGGIAGLFTTTDDSGGGYIFEINDCINNGNISKNDGSQGWLVNNSAIGGILGKKISRGGEMDKFIITDCENTADIYCATDVFVGGIAGYLASDTSEIKTVSNCLNHGDIYVTIIDYYDEDDTKVYNYAGGIAGTAQDTVWIDNCESKGSFIVASGNEKRILYQENCGLTVSAHNLN